MAPVLRGLPPDIAEVEVTRPELLLRQDGRLSIYFVPFDLVRPTAKVMVLGLTPGRHQMWAAVRAASAALRVGASVNDAVDRAMSTAGFAGSMRTNLIGMLDGIGLHTALGLDSAGRLFTERTDLASNTSALSHAVFVNGRNYSGSPPIERTLILK